MENSKTTTGGGGNKTMAQQENPARPYRRNCVFFISGTCRYGENCRFYHPPQMDAPVAAGEEKKTPKVDHSTSTGNIPCKFYRAGVCRYGPYCRFNHSLPESGMQYNSDGLPMRLGAKICSFYMKSGMCGYGALCKFHHPELKNISIQEYGAYVYGEAEEYPDGSTAGEFTQDQLLP